MRPLASEDTDSRRYEIEPHYIHPFGAIADVVEGHSVTFTAWAVPKGFDWGASEDLFLKRMLADIDNQINGKLQSGVASVARDYLLERGQLIETRRIFMNHEHVYRGDRTDSNRARIAYIHRDFVLVRGVYGMNSNLTFNDLLRWNSEAGWFPKVKW